MNSKEIADFIHEKKCPKCYGKMKSIGCFQSLMTFKKQTESLHIDERTFETYVCGKCGYTEQYYAKNLDEGILEKNP